MDNKQEILYSLKAGLSIIERTLAGRSVPFKMVDTFDDERGIYAQIDIEGERFYIVPVNNGKFWVADFPVKNTDGTGLPPGFVGFPTDIAGTIANYYEQKPKGPYQKLSGIGTINLNEVVKEEMRKVFLEFDYAAAEREYYDKQDYEAFEAQVASALGLIQDLRGSANNIQNQIDLETTKGAVDKHLEEAIKSINQAIESYFKTLSPSVSKEVMDRIREINIDK